MYSRQAVDLWAKLAGGTRSVIIQSPDHRSKISAKYLERDGDGRVVLNVSGYIGSLRIDIGPGVGSELLWAPDSQAFFVTTSDQGLNGSYRVIVISNFEDHLTSQDISPLIYKTFGHPVKCGWPETPNVGGITWLGKGNRLLVAAEIVNHSNCDSFGTFRAYEIDTQQKKVLASYDQLETKRQFRSSLGTELIDAPDKCIQNPKTCYVRTNHP